MCISRFRRSLREWLRRSQPHYFPLLFTTLVLASFPIAASEYTSELPPEIPEFDLSDLKELGVTQRDAWEKYQEQMRDAFEETVSFHETEPNKKLIIVAWNRFLTTFASNNPLSEEDELLRDGATEHLSTIKEDVSSTNRLPNPQLTQEKAQAHENYPAIENESESLEENYVYFPDVSFSNDDHNKKLEVVLAALESKENLEQAITVSSELLSLYSNTEGADDALMVKLRIIHSHLLWGAGRTSEVSDELKYIDEHLARQNSLSADELLSIHFLRGWAFSELGEYKKAHSAFLLSQHLLQRIHGFFTIRQLSISSYLTATNLRQRDFLGTNQQYGFAVFVQSHHLDRKRVFIPH